MELKTNNKLLFYLLKRGNVVFKQQICEAKLKQNRNKKETVATL